MRHHDAFAEALFERERDALAHAAGRHEDERRAVGENLLREAIVDFAPHLAAGNRAEFVAGDFDGERHFAAAADVGDGDVGAEESATRSSGRTVAERPMRCGFGCRRAVTSASRRASVSIKCAPRLLFATAWISSTMTVATLPKSARDFSAVRRM